MMRETRDVSFMLEEEPHNLNKCNFKFLEENSISLASVEFTLTSIESRAERYEVSKNQSSIHVSMNHTFE